MRKLRRKGTILNLRFPQIYGSVIEKLLKNSATLEKTMAQTIELENEDYEKLSQMAKTAGVSIQSFIKGWIHRGENKSRFSNPPLNQADQILEDFQKNPELDLKGYSKKLMEDVREFRENFEFRHDQE